MKRSKEDRELLLHLGFNPDNPDYVVERVTATETELTTKKETLRMADMEKRAGQYIALRDVISKMEDEHTEALKPYKEKLELLAGVIHKFLDEHNLENLKTAAGTCYIKTRWTATVADADAFMRFVIESENFDLLERRASATAVKAYVEDHNTLPTGVNLNAIASVGVRRPTGGSKS